MAEGISFWRFRKNSNELSNNTFAKKVFLSSRTKHIPGHHGGRTGALLVGIAVVAVMAGIHTIREFKWFPGQKLVH